MTDGSLVAKEIYVHNAPLGKLSQLKGVGEKRKEIVRETLRQFRIKELMRRKILTTGMLKPQEKILVGLILIWENWHQDFQK